MNRLDKFPDIELNSDIERSGKVGMYIILFCLVALALILAGYFASKAVTDRTGPLIGMSEGSESELVPETQIEFSDASNVSAQDSAEVSATDELIAAVEEQVDAESLIQPESTDVGTNLIETPMTLEDVFDNGLMFVSASEPKYVITGDERRLDLGDEVDEQTLLAGITNENVILERRGNFIVIGLPEPTAE